LKYNVNLFICFIFLHTIVIADTGKISGVLKDQTTGESLAGANVIIVGNWLANGTIAPLITPMGAAADEDGFYFVLNLAPGKYAVKAMMVGYESKQIVDVQVESGRTRVLNFDLKSSLEETETVTVVAEKEMIKLDVASSQQILTGEETQNLPMNNIEEILSLSAGVSIDPYSNSIDIRGGGP